MLQQVTRPSIMAVCQWMADTYVFYHEASHAMLRAFP